MAQNTDVPESRGPRQPAATITVYPDGPLIVRGDVQIRSLDGQVVQTSSRSVALCRCGRSALKPLCDGSHKVARSGAGRSGTHSPNESRGA